MDAGDSLRKLLVPIRLGDAAHPSSSSPAPLQPPAVLSELLLCGGAAAAGPVGEGRGAGGAEIVNVLVVPGNPGVVTYYADYLVALRRALGGAVGTIVCLCHAGHTAVPSSAAGAERLFSLEDQIEHKVEFLRHAAHYLAEARAEDKGAPRRPQGQGEGHDWALPHGSTPGPGGRGRWILIGHSIGAYICVQVQKRLAAQDAANGGGQVQVLGSSGAPGQWRIQVIGLFPFLAVNPQSKEQRTLSWVSHRTLLIAMLAYLAHALGRVLPRGLLRGLIRATMGKGWSPTAVDATRQYLLRAPILRNYAYMGMTEFDYFGRTPLDWDGLQRHSADCSLVFGEDDHWGPVAQYHEIQRRIPHLRVLLDQEGHPHTFCCTLAGSRSIAQLSAQICREGMLAEGSKAPAGA